MKISMEGKRFGRLMVLQDSGKRGSDGSILWTCKCDCGNTKDILGTNLRNGKVVSCGCYQKEKAKETINNNRNTPKSLIGNKYGKLLVLEDSGQRTKQRRIIYKCQCDCGRVALVSSACLVSGDTISCGCLKQSRGEYYIEQCLKNNNIIYEREFTNYLLKSEKNGYYRFDFALFKSNLLIGLIEFDGKQHFEQLDEHIFTKSRLEEIQHNDKIKNQYCKDYGIPLLRIRYDEKDIDKKVLEFYSSIET